MIAIPRDDTGEAAPSWHRRGHTSLVYVRCPNGHGPFGLDHDVAKDGKVTPSLVCPIDGCGFHEFGRLEGWSAD